MRLKVNDIVTFWDDEVAEIIEILSDGHVLVTNNQVVPISDVRIMDEEEIADVLLDRAMLE